MNIRQYCMQSAKKRVAPRKCSPAPLQVLAREKQHGDTLIFGGYRYKAQEGSNRSGIRTGVSENEEQLQEIFSQAPVGIAQTGSDGQWLRVNDRFCEMVGYSRTELPGKTILDITHPEDREASLTAVLQTSCRRDFNVVEGETLHPQGWQDRMGEVALYVACAR